MSDLRFVPVENLPDNVFRIIGNDWFLLSAGDKREFNMMTASWGSLGILWNKPVATVFVRPSRFTFGLMERFDHFSLSFFGPEYRKALDFCGANSGRNVDKAARTGLTPVFEENDRIYFAEARLVLVCRKLYTQDLDPNRVLVPSVPSSFYTKDDWHRAYTGEIVRCLRRD